MSRLKNPVGEGDHIQGPNDAPCTLVEYGDYECPHCAAAFPIIKQVQKHFGNQMRFVFRNFPLTQIHPYAEPAAEAAEFAAIHHKFWEMHDLIFENQDELDGVLYEIARNLKLPSREFADALESHRFLSHIEEELSGGARSGVNGTPTFFINGQRFEGLSNFESLTEAIVEFLP